MDRAMYMSAAFGLTIALVLGGADPLHAMQTPVSDTAEAAALRGSELDKLVAEFESELAVWKELLRAAEGGRERAAIRRENPTPQFGARFESLADAGEIRALFWLLDNLRDLGGRSAERKERRLELYERLIRDHGESELLAEGLERLHGDTKLVREQGLDTVERLTSEAIELVDSETQRDILRLGLARCYARSNEAASVKKAVALFDRILAAKLLPEVELEDASKCRFRLLHLRVGAKAPDFGGRTVDGEVVRLSDHLGKVVVLDFFGFW